MEKATSSTHRASITGQPAQAPTAAQSNPSHPPGSGPVRDPAALSERALPTRDGTGLRAYRSVTELERVTKNAAASAVALGSCFGTMTALNNAVRAVHGVSVRVKAFTGLLPSASVFATPWVEDGMRAALGTQATYPVQPSLAHDAVAGTTLFLFNRACARSARIPRFPPASRAGMAATVVQATVASVFAGGASEITAQWMNAHIPAGEGAPSAPPPLDNTRKATGRLLSQAPAATLQTAMAFASKDLLPKGSLVPLGVVTGGWCFRRVLIPPQATPGTEPLGARAADSQPLFPVSSIPPA